ncbi:MAG: tryptophan--tRNA ligase [Myxococcota bacterium]
MPRYLSGIQPSGRPHLGNYFGAMVQHLEAAQRAAPGGDDALFFIADLHALTTVTDAALVRTHVQDVAASYLALGLDTSRCHFFRQSDIPEVTELTWLLSTCTGMGLLERAHSYKDKTARGIPASVGLFTYPVPMAADILIYDADVVPVGKDQVQHIEMTQDMAGHFNTRWGTAERPLLRRPEWQLSTTPKVPGTDGEKMSKSYDNTIWIFEEGKALKKAVNAIVTDSRLPEEPKDPDTVNAFLLLELFLSPDESKDWRARLTAGGSGAPGYGDLKKALMAKMDERFGAARERYRTFLPGGPHHVDAEELLQTSAGRARALAQDVLGRCYEAVGMPNAARRLRRG